MTVFRVITIEREFGCGGGAIAAKVAATLGWELWDHRLSQEVARMAQVDCSAVDKHAEKLDGRLYRLAKYFFRGSNYRGVSRNDSRIFDADCMVSLTRTLSLRVAEAGNSVMVGHGAPYFLMRRSDTLHVFLYASRSEKIRRLVADGITEKEAGQLVDIVDRERTAFVKYYFHSDWPTRGLYHLMVNTAMGDDQVIEIIVDTMHRLEPAPEGPTGFGDAQ